MLPPRSTLTPNSRRNSVQPMASSDARDAGQLDHKHANPAGTANAQWIRPESTPPATGKRLIDRTREVQSPAPQPQPLDDFQIGYAVGTSWLQAGPQRGPLDTPLQELINRSQQDGDPQDCLPRLISGFAHGLDLSKRDLAFVNQLLGLLVNSLQPPAHTREQLQGCLHAVALVCAPQASLTQAAEIAEPGMRVDYVKGAVRVKVKIAAGEGEGWAELPPAKAENICGQNGGVTQGAGSAATLPSVLQSNGFLATAWTNGASGMHLEPLWTLANPETAPKERTQPEDDPVDIWEETSEVSVPQPATQALGIDSRNFDKEGLRAALQRLTAIEHQDPSDLPNRVEALRGLIPTEERLDEAVQVADEETAPNSPEQKMRRLQSLVPEWNEVVESLAQLAEGAQAWDQAVVSMFNEPESTVLDQFVAASAFLRSTASEYLRLMGENKRPLDRQLEGLMDKVDKLRAEQARQASLVESLREREVNSFPAPEGEPLSTAMQQALVSNFNQKSAALGWRLDVLTHQIDVTPGPKVQSLLQDQELTQAERVDEVEKLRSDLRDAEDAVIQDQLIPQNDEDRPGKEAPVTAKLHYLLSHLPTPLRAQAPDDDSGADGGLQFSAFDDDAMHTPPRKRSIVGNQE